ncbi:unnamed protein product [Rhizophagus irregularis]|nr:unnamed protein product [Rhizophagus irregularis]
MKIKEAVKKVADTTTSNIPSRSNVWSHVSSRLSSPHVSSSQSGNLTCIYCNGFHWVAYCDKIPPEFKGHCVKCWSSKSYKVKLVNLTPERSHGFKNKFFFIFIFVQLGLDVSD